MTITKNDLSETNFFASADERRILLDLFERIEKLERKDGEIRTSLRRAEVDCTWFIQAGEVMITEDNTIADVLRHLVEECNGDKTEVCDILDRL